MAWTAPRTWVAAEVMTASNMNTHVRDNLKAIGDPWVAYTPAWTATTTNPVIGNGSLTGAYKVVGDKTCHFRAQATFGTTTTFGTGGYILSLPFTAIGGTINISVASGFILQTSRYGIHGFIAAGTAVMALYYVSVGTTAQWSNVGPTTPVTLTATTGNFIFISGTFETA